MRTTSPSVRLAEARGRAPLAKLLQRAAHRGTNLQEVAAELGCSVATVRHWVRDAGGFIEPIHTSVIRFDQGPEIRGQGSGNVKDGPAFDLADLTPAP